MSARSRQGKHDWQQRHPDYAGELREQIIAGAGARWAGWAARGRVPWWVRAKARIRGRQLPAPVARDGDGSR